jgi:hypothetical protein
MIAQATFVIDRYLGVDSFYRPFFTRKVMRSLTRLE